MFRGDALPVVCDAEPDDVVVALGAHTDRQAVDVVRLRIADNGQGVAAEHRESVFRRGESHAKMAGSGFGLFFVDAMVDAYGGEVRIEDNDPGAAFVLELPPAAGTGDARGAGRSE